MNRLSTSGVLLAISCYVIWGIVPVYWKAVDAFDAREMLAARILWTLVVMGGFLAISGRGGEVANRAPSSGRWTFLAAGLLAINWGVFIYAVQIDQVLATSLGYFVNPLMSVVMGMVFLGERLTRIQTLSVAIAAIGVVAMTIAAGELPWIALVLASSFAVYGLLHKLRPQPPFGGLVREMLALSPLAIAWVAWLLSRSQAALADADARTHALVALAGPVTAIPLLLFHASTRRLPLVVVGMFQYIAPTLTFLIATLVYDEPFTRADALGFGLVWLGLALFLGDALQRTRALVRR